MRNVLAKAAMAAAVGLTAVTTPAAAVTRPVEKSELTHFVIVGATVLGRDYVPLGGVSKVNPHNGLVGIVGNHGEFFVTHFSLLRRDGYRLFAPELSIADVAQIALYRSVEPDAVVVAKASIPALVAELPPNSVRLLPQRRTRLLAELDTPWQLAALNQ